MRNYSYLTTSLKNTQRNDNNNGKNSNSPTKKNILSAEKKSYFTLLQCSSTRSKSQLLNIEYFSSETNFFFLNISFPVIFGYSSIKKERKKNITCLGKFNDYQKIIGGKQRCYSKTQNANNCIFY